jgi:hypothetical protein
MSTLSDRTLSGEEAIEARRWRGGFLATSIVLVILTWLVLRDPAAGVQGLMVVLLVWVLLGYASFFAAANAYGPHRSQPRPYLVVGRGIPAWAFFVGGGGILLIVSIAWLFWGNLRTALTVLGITIMYLSVSYPRPLSLRRAIVPGIGLVVVTIGQFLP